MTNKHKYSNIRGMENLSVRRFPANAKDYKLYEEVGDGVSATVYRALCIPLEELVAIKVLDLEKCNNDLDRIRQEVQIMRSTEHPNIVRAHCSFTVDRSLWVVMPYMAGGSCLQIMKSSYPDGFEQPVIATLLREVLKALVYLHSLGLVHRDVKAGNILVDSTGSIKLADFGVSACMFDTGDRLHSRNTFVGTPCWMAPEVMEQLNGYDFKADIWSFGITAIELAHGHAPFSKYSPLKVLMMTLQSAPPGLDLERDKRFSKSFKEIVSACLEKDPKKRPSSEKLLKHPFFKHARSNDFLARAMLCGLPPLGDRYRILKEKDASGLLQNQAMHGDKDQSPHHMRGISAWNFNLEDLKKQAAPIPDDDSVKNRDDTNHAFKQECESLTSNEDKLSVERLSNDVVTPLSEVILDAHCSIPNTPNSSAYDLWNSSNEIESCGSRSSDDTNACNTRLKAMPVVPSAARVENTRTKCITEGASEGGSRFKGRFKLEMEDIHVQDSTNGFIGTLAGGSVGSTNSTRDPLLLPSLQCLLQQNSMQREQLQRLLNDMDQSMPSENVSLTSTNERDLKLQIFSMNQSIAKLHEELQRFKTKNSQL